MSEKGILGVAMNDSKKGELLEVKIGDEPNEEQIEEWREEKTAKQQMRWSNVRQSLAILKKNGIYFEAMDEKTAHYRVGPYDFWPTTGMFMHRQTKAKERGVFNLIALLDGQDTRFCDKHMETDCFATVIECNDCAFFLKDI